MARLSRRLEKMSTKNGRARDEHRPAVDGVKRTTRGPWTWRVVVVVLACAGAAAWAVVATQPEEPRVGRGHYGGPPDEHVYRIVSHLEEQMQKSGTLPDLSGLEDRMVDEYGTDLRITIDYSTVTVTSAGKDRTFDTEDDCRRSATRWTGSRPANR